MGKIKPGQDAAFVKEVLPATYQVADGNRAIRCTSAVGIADDETEWPRVMQAFRDHFSQRLLEVAHQVCHHHTEFTIYLR